MFLPSSINYYACNNVGLWAYYVPGSMQGLIMCLLSQESWDRDNVMSLIQSKRKWQLSHQPKVTQQVFSKTSLIKDPFLYLPA